jgi:hypothetical protein
MQFNTDFHITDFKCTCNKFVRHNIQIFHDHNTVKPVLNGISRGQKIFPLKPGFRLIKVYYNNIINQGT